MIDNRKTAILTPSGRHLLIQAAEKEDTEYFVILLKIVIMYVELGSKPSTSTFDSKLSVTSKVSGPDPDTVRIIGQYLY